MNTVSYYFLPWVRYGLWKNAQNGKSVPELGEKAGTDGFSSIPSRAKIPIELKLSKNNAEQNVDGINLSLFGPGDVVGIDAREIVRTEPRHLTPDFLPNLFPFIEFDRPDFPWLFTPGKQDANDCLLPWIILVVLPKTEGEIITDPAKPYPELLCAINELPDLKESWAWAHAQYMGESGKNAGDIPQQLANQPLQNVSRLLCARKLKPNEHYLACVVPAFTVTESTDQQGNVISNLKPSWEHGNNNPTLPVYYQWEFSTAAEGDFEDFITRLKKPAELDEKIQQTFFRRMDISGLLGGAELKTLDIISALELEVGAQQNSTDTDILKDAEDALTKQISASQEPNDNVPLPMYGSRHVLKNNASPPEWFNNLNLDPRYRVAAALGTQVIQRQQEQLMAVAWEKVAGLDAVNQFIRQKQLGREVTNSFFGRIDKLSDAVFLQVTEPVAGAVALGNQMTVSSNIAAHRSAQRISTQPAAKRIAGRAILSSHTRRLLRPNGRLFRQGMATEEQKLQLKSFITSRGLATAVSAGTLPPISVVGGTTLSPLPGAVTGVIPVAEWTTPVEVVGSVPQPSAEDAETQRLKALRITRMNSLRPDESFKSEMQERLNINKPPENVSRGARSLKLVTKAGEAPSTADQNLLDTITNVQLSFSQAMCEPLRDFFQEMFIPGLNQIPNNSLVILKTNLAFIEAYMVGLNHEMSRELLWREYPTYLGNSYFPKFWNDHGSSSPTTEKYDIGSWQKELGGNMREGMGDLWMLLIKGDLLTRYPNTIIYAQNNGKSTFPILRVSPVPGVTLLGFNINPPPDKSDGWSFVLEEHPTETRFGLDISRDKKEDYISWHQLSWEDVVLHSDDRGYIKLKPEIVKTPADDKKVSWAKNSANMAYITLQQPFRYIIPSSEWFSSESS